MERYVYSGMVTRVIDGDTVVASVDLGFALYHQVTFRLYGINAPEMHGVSKMAGLKAQAFLLDRLMGQKAIFRTHKDATEKYGRYLVEIWNDESAPSLNQQMIDNGLAVRYLP
jgi:micrococcal nuclease